MALLDLFRSKKSSPPLPTNQHLADQVQRGFRQYPSFGLNMTRLRDILVEADYGETTLFMEYLDDVANDPHFGMLLRKRKMAVAGACGSVTPFDDTALSKQIADEFNAYDKRIPNARQLKFDMLDAIFRGFGLFEPQWDYVAGKQEVVSVKPIESRFLRFTADGDITGRHLPKLITVGNGAGVPIQNFIDCGDLWFVEWRDKVGEVVRGGLGRSLARLFVYKTYNGFIDGASWIERFGHIPLTIEYPKHLKPGDAQLEDIREAALSMITDMVGLFPEGTKVTVIDNVNKAATVKDVYIAWVDALDQQATKAVLHQTMTTGKVAGQTGGYADAQVGGDEEQSIHEDDAEWLSAQWTRLVINPWLLRNYGPDAKLGPYVIDVAPVEDKSAKTNRQQIRMQTITAAVLAGLPISQAEAYTELGFTPPTDGEPVLKAVPPTIKAPTKVIEGEDSDAA